MYIVFDKYIWCRLKIYGAKQACNVQANASQAVSWSVKSQPKSVYFELKQQENLQLLHKHPKCWPGK